MKRSSSSATKPAQISGVCSKQCGKFKNGFFKNSNRSNALGPCSGARNKTNQLFKAAAARVVDNFQPVSSRIFSAGPRRANKALARRAAKRSWATKAILVLPALTCSSMLRAAVQASSSKLRADIKRQFFMGACAKLRAICSAIWVSWSCAN